MTEDVGGTRRIQKSTGKEVSVLHIKGITESLDIIGRKWHGRLSAGGMERS